MNWALLYVFVNAAAGFAMLWQAYLGYQRRFSPGSRDFIVLVFALSWWLLAYSAELANDDLAAKITWEKIKYLGMVVIPVAWLTFTAKFTAKDQWITPRSIGLLMIFPLLTVLVVWTNEWHSLFWTATSIDDTGVIPVLKSQYGVWALLASLYLYGLVLVGVALMLRSAIISFKQYRPRALVILTAVGIALMGNIISVLNLPGVQSVDLTPLFIAFSAVVMALGLMRFGLLDIAPIAYDTVMENIPDGVCVVNAQGVILGLNANLCATLGIPTTQAIGKTLIGLLPDYTDTLKEVIAQPGNHAEINLNETTLEIKVAPLLDSMQRTQGYVYIFRDISAHRQATNELNNRVNQLMIMRQVYSEAGGTLNIQQVQRISLDAAMRLSGADAGYIALNRDGFFTIDEFIGPYRLDETKRVLQAGVGVVGQAIVSHDPQLVVDLTSDADNGIRLVNTRALMVIPLLSQEQQMVGLLNLETRNDERFNTENFEFLQTLAGYIAIALENARLHRQTNENLLEMQQLYHRVKRLENLKTDMIRIAAHDLGNPLTAIKSGLDLMLEFDQETLTRQQIDDLRRMQSAANRMRDMIDNILSLERIERLAQMEVSDVFDFADRVKRAVQEYLPQAQSQQQNFSAHIPTDDPIQVEGDVAQIYEAVTNLISNAIKYTPVGGDVQVSIDLDEGQLTFSVVDTGYGIPEDQQDRLFQPFYRAKTEETSEIEGNGLGLHLVKNIIERHQGRMLFESTYGEGSMFGFTLPTVDVSVSVNRQTPDAV